jgi:hypothetical protein
LRTPKKKAAPKRRYKEMENLILRHPVLAVKPQRAAPTHTNAKLEQDVIAYTDLQQQEYWVRVIRLGRHGCGGG